MFRKISCEFRGLEGRVGVLGAVGALFSGSLLGKVVGVVRELLLATLFGTSALVGAYRIAQTATLIPVQFFAADTLNAGFIPLYTRYAKQDKAKANTLFWILQIGLLALSLFIMGFLFWGAPWLVGILAPGLDAQTGRMAAIFVRIMVFGVPFYVVGALFSYLEMANGYYLLASLRASLQSVGLIAGTLAAFWFGQPVFLAWGFTGAYIIFSFWGAVLLLRRGLLWWPRKWLWPEVCTVLGAFWQTIRHLLLLPFMLQGNIAIERVVASLMGVSVVAALDYAKFITETGVVLLAVPLGLAGLATFSDLTPDGAQERLERMLPIVLVVNVPISIYMAVHNELVISLLYQRGAFDETSVALTKSIFFGLAIGLWAQVAGYVLIKALNAQIRNREVIVFMALALGINILTNIILYRIIGPLALGLGASLYGLVLFLLATKALQLSRVAVPCLAWLGLGATLYVPLGLSLGGETWIDLGISGVVSVVFWLVYIGVTPLLRASVLPLWGYVHRGFS